MSYEEIIEKYNLRLELHRIPFRTDIDDWKNDKEARHFSYRIYVLYGDRSGKEIKGYFSQGSAHRKNPTIVEILDALSSDTQELDGQGFEDWASSYGYEEDSRKAYKIWEMCLKEAQDLRSLLGYEGVRELYECERL